MAVKVEVNEVEKSEYPCIKKSYDGWVVLFINPSFGTCLVKGSPGDTKVGEYHGFWSEGRFKPLTGSITLSNE